MSQYVTRTELAGQLSPLVEIRTMLRDDNKALRAGQDALSEQLRDTKDEITARMDVANGRTAKLEGEVLLTRADVNAAKLELKDIDTTAKDIYLHGCQQMPSHARTLTALAHVGALSGEVVDDSPVAGFTKRNAKRGLLGGALVGLGAALPHLWAFINWVGGLFTR